MEVSSEGLNMPNYFDPIEITGEECRLCTVKSDQVLQIFQNHNELARKIMAFAAVQITEGDGLPTIICYTCQRLLDMSWDFKCQVEKSDAKFRQCVDLKPQLNDYTTISHSVVQSVNEVITEAIADEITLHRGENHIELPLASHHSPTPLINDLTSANAILFDVDDHEKGAIVMQKHLPIDPISVNLHLTDENNDLVEKLEQYVDHEHGELIKEEESAILGEESELSDDDHVYQEEIFTGSQSLKVEEIIANQSEKIEITLHCENDENSDEEKPLSSRAPRHKCVHCIKTFPTKSGLDRHETVHSGKTELRYVCSICDRQFSTINKLKSHITTHDSLKNDDKSPDEVSKSDEDKVAKKTLKYSCKYCSKQFTYEKPFKSHAKRHAENQSQETQDENTKRTSDEEDIDLPREGLQCTQCGRIFATKRNLKRHLSTHSGLRFSCTSCNKEFARLDKLKAHEQIKHKDDIFGDSDDDDDDDTDNENKNLESENSKKEKHNRPHKCPMCPKAFAQQQSLTNHMERHKRVKDTQKRFLCEVCSKCFAQSGSLVAHMRTHTGIKPYVCNVCNRAFTKSTYLQLHLRTHSGEKPYICQYCSRAFARANTLARHITMHTGEAKYHCQICLKSFRRLTSLNEHTYTHTGQRPYACKICTKRYNNAGSLYAHTKKCKAQQLSGSGTFVVAADDINNQNANSSSSMIVYTQRKLSDTMPIAPETPNTQFIISNIHNQKTQTPNLQPFVAEETNYPTTAKTFVHKNSYYTIYPGM